MNLAPSHCIISQWAAGRGARRLVTEFVPPALRLSAPHFIMIAKIVVFYRNPTIRADLFPAVSICISTNEPYITAQSIC